MNSFCKLLLIIVIFCSQAKAQGYEITYEYVDLTYVFVNSQSVSAVAQFKHITGTKTIPAVNGYGKGVIKIPNKPTHIVLTTYEEQNDYGVPVLTCGPQTQTFILALKDCDSFSKTLIGACGSAKLQFTIKPILNFVHTDPAGDYCIDESPVCIALSSYSQIQWQFRTENQNWSNVSQGDSLFLHIKQLFGTGYSSLLNKHVYLRYSTNECNPDFVSSPAAGPYLFQPSKPKVTGANIKPPSCNQEKDASIQLNSLDRQLVAGEILTYTIYSDNNQFIAQIRSSNQPSDSAPVIFNGTNRSVAPFGISAGRFNLLVESTASFCGQIEYFPIKIDEPDSLLLRIENNTDPSCPSNTEDYSPNGKIVLKATGGTGAPSYSINNEPYQTSNLFDSLSVGTFRLKAQDSNGCESPTMIIQLKQPPVLVLDATPSPASCFNKNDGAIVMETTGGTPGYSYALSPTPAITQNVFDSLYTGTYTVTARDANNCTIVQTVHVSAPPQPTIQVKSFIPTTCGLANGAIEIDVGGETGPFQYRWKNLLNDTLSEFSAMTSAAAGTYILSVVDDLGCTRDTSFSIPPSTPPTISPGQWQPPSCKGRNDGTAHLEITGGTAPYSVTWSDDVVTIDRTNLSSGLYHVTIRDKNNCFTETDVNIPEAIPIVIQTKTLREANCRPDLLGLIEVEASGGSGRYEYAWDTGATGSLLDNCSSGKYSVTVTDDKQCSTSLTLELKDFRLHIPDTAACDRQHLTISSPVSDSQCEWKGPAEFSSRDSIVSIVDPGLYTLSINTALGCQHTTQFNLRNDNLKVNADFLMTSQAFVGDTIVAIDISWPIPTHVDWTFDAHAKVIDEGNDYSYVRFDEPGIYTIKLLAAIGACGGEKSQTIHVLEKPEGDPLAEEGSANKNSVIRVFSVHPNPVQGMLNVEISLREMRDAQLELYHLGQNRRMIHAALEKNTEYNPRLDLSTMPPGAYVLTLRAGPELKTIRIIKL